MKVILTHRQHEYLMKLSEGPHTTRELMLHFGVTINSTYRMLHKLVAKGLVESERMRGVLGNVHIHRLIKPYDTLDLTIKNNCGRNTARRIPDEEILYAAILRNGDMVGQRLYGQFKRLFPDRSDSSIKNIVGIARIRGLNGRWLCR